MGWVCQYWCQAGVPCAGNTGACSAASLGWGLLGPELFSPSWGRKISGNFEEMGKKHFVETF